MKWLLIIAGILLLSILVLLVIGLLQPVKHSVTRSIRLQEKPEVIFALIADMTNAPTWSSTVEKVEPLSAQDGHAMARCTLKWGGMQMVMTQIECTPPARLVTSMAKDNGTVLGTWTYQITPDSGGCTVSLTEEGELKNPLFRALARMRGLDANITQTLHDLGAKFGENGGAN